MSVLIDPPLWPAHGTTFSHLVSDASVDELHAFALEAGLPPRAFDRDHYDVPASRHSELVARGAIPVTAGELTRALIAGGVRVPARERPDRHDAWLRRDFDSILSGRETLREDLLSRWSGPERHYHDRRHLAQVLRGLDWLVEREGHAPAIGADPASPALPARLAAWWHDAVYNGTAGADEQASAELAFEHLSPALSLAERQRVADLILMTAHHDPQDTAAELLSDADLRVLARPTASYRRYVSDVRKDYAHVSDHDFALGRARVLESLLAKNRLFATRSAHTAWEASARENLAGELKEIEQAGM